ncbi:MAG: 16S rRNA (adenine(1518)-N(6)/adenine(1519)-N(6))-dimethyltransferase [Gammaproteobacteria bacterium RIFCSPHIGHO2_02_FULL_42_13]|nr:MAG: 16S rRNA (adenine(1518)-N(6)/adenine(1519)-N(6))-dimethyltransferase [Gammaproteobacteria bacterium RIFCSPHIGHO2_02_FULL_42_13]OGT69226.1 MAG: 16S rRNA (adenine(1518)-N(6)/adenine(1519)-N(6))-dimethyltransferase [Gammaproteobacteria bacterium RIFCSPLOWO2_02_FULL_42_9]
MFHQPRKRFGQNFLSDETVLDRIVSAIHPKSEQSIVEIGPGLGALTKKLLPLVNKLDAVELDRDLIPKLQASCAGLGELIIHQQDALKFDFASVIKNKQKLRIVGNLPYNISTPLLFYLLTFAPYIQDMYFMLQKEVAHRLASAPGNKTYGRLSVMVQYYCTVEILFDVEAVAFNPKPKVDSAFIRLVPYDRPPYFANDFDLFAELVNAAFTQRRKTIRNALGTFISAEALESLNISPTLRPENLTIEQFVRIANQL